MLKDLGLALEAAIQRESPVALGGLAESLYAAHKAAGNGSLGFSSVIRMLQSRNA